MTNEEINVAIAEHLGWTRVRVIPPYHRRKSEGPTIAGNPPATSEDRSILVQDYCGSLDAMHELENALDDEQYLEFTRFLMDECQEFGRVWRHSSASAKQRAECFLRTVGKWKEAL